MPSEIEAPRGQGRGQARQGEAAPRPGAEDDYVPDEPQAPQDPVEDEDDDFENSCRFRRWKPS
jgi:RNA polymerase primary sigma factor